MKIDEKALSAATLEIGFAYALRSPGEKPPVLSEVTEAAIQAYERALWKDAKVELPDIDKLTLIRGSGGSVYAAFCREEIEEGVLRGWITHWRYLPELPGETE